MWHKNEEEKLTHSHITESIIRYQNFSRYSFLPLPSMLVLLPLYLRLLFSLLFFKASFREAMVRFVVLFGTRKFLNIFYKVENLVDLYRNL